MINTWATTISEPDLADWVTVAAYLVAALLAARAAGRSRLRRKSRDTFFWALTAVLLCLLSINELLDIQTLLTIAVRAHARAYGWYGEHRQLQYAFVMALALSAVLLAIALLWLTRRADSMVRLALLGLIFITAFVVLRAASFHHLDELLGGGLSSFNWGSVQEMIGILVVITAAARYNRRKVRKR